MDLTSHIKTLRNELIWKPPEDLTAVSQVENKGCRQADVRTTGTTKQKRNLSSMTDLWWHWHTNGSKLDWQVRWYGVGVKTDWKWTVRQKHDGVVQTKWLLSVASPVNHTEKAWIIKEEWIEEQTKWKGNTAEV